MEYLWSKGYVHSDIKPQNILVKGPNVDQNDAVNNLKIDT